MENGHVADITNSSNTHAATAEAATCMEDTPEYRILRAYARRRRPLATASGPARPGPAPTAGQRDVEEKKGEEKSSGGRRKRSSRLKRIGRLLGCIGPQPEPVSGRPPSSMFRSAGSDGGPDRDEDGDEVAGRLMAIADKIPFTPPELESDNHDEVEKLIGLLLREEGDKFNESVLRDVSLTAALGDYGFFSRLMSSFLRGMGFDPDAVRQKDVVQDETVQAETVQTESEEAQVESVQTQMALTCEVTSRLSAVDTLPTSRLLGFGASYLQTHFSSWAAQRGGYEDVFHDEDEDEEVH